MERGGKRKREESETTKKKAKEATPIAEHVVIVFSALPDEILIRILGYLDMWELPHIARVNKRFWQLSADDTLWQSPKLAGKQFNLNETGERAYILKFPEEKENTFEFEAEWLWLGTSVKVAGTCETKRWRVVFTATKITNMSGSIAGGETSVKGTFDGVITRKSVKLNVSDDLKKILETYVPKAMMDRLKGIQLWLGGGSCGPLFYMA